MLRGLHGAGALDRVVRLVCWLEMLGFVPHPNLRPYKALNCTLKRPGRGKYPDRRGSQGILSSETRFNFHDDVNNVNHKTIGAENKCDFPVVHR